MSAILQMYTDLFTTWGDPRTASWPLIASPIPIVLIVGLYLYFVLSFGPIMMRDLKPFQLRKTILVYNAGQVLTCAYVVYKAFQLAWGGYYQLICEPVDYSYDERAVEIAKIVNLYMYLKLADLLDTVFFVLRKKSDQITFLHVYHHVGMILMGWVSTKYLAGGHGTALGVVNSFVHVVMYSYYFLTMLDKNHKKSMWWKKHITQLQFVQFGFNIVHFSSLLLASECAYPRWPAVVAIPQAFMMIVLFTDFYVKDYIKPTVKQTEKKLIATKAAPKDFIGKEGNKSF